MKSLLSSAAWPAVLIACVPLIAAAQIENPLQEVTFSVTVQNAVSGQYLVYLPDGYEDGEAWPLVVFLHGAGERGYDLEKVKIHGPAKRIEAGHRFPFILVAPQNPPDDWWTKDLLDGVMADVLDKYAVDRSRIYLTGLSMGGYGTWEYAIRHPDLFAAIAPICGGGNLRTVCRIKDVPVWTFHGALDTVIPISESIQMVNALRTCGGDVTFTVYPNAGHDSWTETYASEEFYEWLLSHQRKSR